MTRRPSPLNPTQRTELAANLRAIADQLEANHARDVQRLLNETAATGYPTRASGTTSTPSNPTDDNGQPTRPPTSVERAALNPDPTARLATDTLIILRRFLVLAPHALRGLTTIDPTRASSLCPRCGHYFDRKAKRCQRIIDGRRCGGDQNVVERRCRICERVMKPGESLRAGRCNADDTFYRRNGYDRNTATRLALDDTVITEQEPA